jgi:hypothetical protein
VIIVPATKAQPVRGCRRVSLDSPVKVVWQPRTSGRTTRTRLLVRAIKCCGRSVASCQEQARAISAQNAATRTPPLVRISRETWTLRSPTTGLPINGNTYRDLDDTPNTRRSDSQCARTRERLCPCAASACLLQARSPSANTRTGRRFNPSP